jgi:hypothetical protein
VWSVFVSDSYDVVSALSSQPKKIALVFGLATDGERVSTFSSVDAVFVGMGFVDEPLGARQRSGLGLFT